MKRLRGTRLVGLDRSLESLPLFRLSDSTEETAISFTTDSGGRWRVLPSPGDRLPGTFDQDVYVELMHRFAESGSPADGCVTFTLHAFLRSMGRQVDGRTYEQLRSALGRLERTTLESTGAYVSAASSSPIDVQFTVLSSVLIERRRVIDREQIALFSSVAAAEPGDARVIISPVVRENLAGGYTTGLSMSTYAQLASPVARRLYRLAEVERAGAQASWRVSLDRLREQLPLTQRYPSHLQRVLRPAHEMLKSSGVVRTAKVARKDGEWFVDYVFDWDS